LPEKATSPLNEINLIFGPVEEREIMVLSDLSGGVWAESLLFNEDDIGSIQFGFLFEHTRNEFQILSAYRSAEFLIILGRKYQPPKMETAIKRIFRAKPKFIVSSFLNDKTIPQAAAPTIENASQIALLPSRLR
jgi:hypothetical protein